MSTSIQPKTFKSARLATKEAIRVINAIFQKHSFDPRWVLDDALWTERVALVNYMAFQHERAYDCHCHECFEEKEQMFYDRIEGLPSIRGYTKDDLTPVLKDLFTAYEKSEPGITRNIILTAIMRFLHGPARELIQVHKFRGTVKAKCMEFIGQIWEKYQYAHNSYDILSEACDSVLFLITLYEDEDAPSIFYGY